jgi:hypothetical protein
VRRNFSEQKPDVHFWTANSNMVAIDNLSILLALRRVKGAYHRLCPAFGGAFSKNLPVFGSFVHI